MKEKGFSTWRSNTIPAGDDWRSEIDKAIKDAYALVVVITPKSKSSEYVTYEWAFAWGASIKVIPILLKDTQIHPRLESLQYLDFRTRTRPWEKLIELLREAKSSKPQEEFPPRSISLRNKTQQNAYSKMIAALRDEKWTWRTIEKLARIGEVSQKNAFETLARDPNVEFSIGEDGRRIAKLRIR